MARFCSEKLISGRLSYCSTLADARPLKATAEGDDGVVRAQQARSMVRVTLCGIVFARFGSDRIDEPEHTAGLAFPLPNSSEAAWIERRWHVAIVCRVALKGLPLRCRATHVSRATRPARASYAARASCTRPRQLCSARV